MSRIYGGNDPLLQEACPEPSPEQNRRIAEGFTGGAPKAEGPRGRRSAITW